MRRLKSPFIWFGGKANVAHRVWLALGDVDNYVEPFAGSLAVLLSRPSWHRGTVETVNDKDMFIANFWRAVAADPDAVARWADWPVNETDLFARHLWLVNEGRRRLSALEADPEWCDAKIAGWWVWGLNAWIGSGWCRGDGPWKPGTADAVGAGQGVHRQLPHLGTPGQGVHRQLPHLSAYMRHLAERLRRVRVCCGDWKRVVTAGALSYGKTVGIFLDPPYSGQVRERGLYREDDYDVAAEARDWAIIHGNDRRLRIVLAGYEEEHGSQMEDAGWAMIAYRKSTSYQTSRLANGDSGNQRNRRQERLWLSPHCLGERPLLLKGGLT